MCKPADCLYGIELKYLKEQLSALYAEINRQGMVLTKYGNGLTTTRGLN